MLNVTCKKKLHPQRSSLKLFFFFHKDGHTCGQGLPPRTLYLRNQGGRLWPSWCEVVPESGWVQKQSPWLDIKVQGKWVREGRHSPGVRASGNWTSWERGRVPQGGTPGAWTVKLDFPPHVPS
jgi:hypothetical protein